jgi:hypothetical protein
MTDANGGPRGGRRLSVYAALDRKDGGKPYWLKVGAAFTNRDGSLSVVMGAFPSSTNRLQIREQRFPEEAPPPAANGARRGKEAEAHQ